MNKEEPLKTILSIAKNILKSLPDNVNLSTGFNSIPRWTSLNHALIINSIEKHYNIEFDLDEMIELSTVGDICELIMKKIN